ncbi:hypothetical protein [Tenacibaculum sp.]|uniref:hypothetical protein n=1 Tax=Tenacibaculum sp. TaxID=1906242 RepID=UPI003AA8F890
MKKTQILLLMNICLIMAFSSCGNNENIKEIDYSNYKLLLTPIEELTRNDFFNTTVTVYYRDKSKHPDTYDLVVQTHGGYSFFNIPEGVIKLEASILFENGKRVKIELINPKGEIVEELIIKEQPYIYITEI